MSEFKIIPIIKLIKLFHAISGLIGLLLTGYVVYAYLAGRVPGDWVLYLPLGVWVMIDRLALGYLKLSYPSISLDKNRLMVDGAGWGVMLISAGYPG